MFDGGAGAVDGVVDGGGGAVDGVVDGVGGSTDGVVDGVVPSGGVSGVVVNSWYSIYIRVQ